MAPRIITPPREELISFEAFSAAMMNAPLDNFHKTYDSDGEHDLEGNYEGEDSDGSNMEDDELKKAGGEDTDLSNDSQSDSDSEADAEINETNTSPPYEYFDARFDINRRNLTPTHSQSRHINPDLQSLIDDTEIFLEQLSLKFQPMIEEQPMSTTIILANQAVEQVLMPYRGYGSQARLSESAMRFLRGGETVRRPGKDGLDGGKDGKLRFKEEDDVVVGGKESGRGEKLKRKADEEMARDDVKAGAGGKPSLKIKILKRSDGTSVIVPATPTVSARVPGSVSTLAVTKSNAKPTVKSETANASSERVGYGYQPAKVMPLDGPETQVDLLSHRKTSGPFDTDVKERSLTLKSSAGSSKTLEVSLYTQSAESLILKPRFMERPTLSVNTNTNSSAKTLYTPLAKSFSTVNINSPTPSPTTSYPPTPIHATPHTYSCTVDPLANAALSREAYNPLSMKFSWPASIKIGSKTKACMPTPGLLDAFNNILHLYNAEGRNLLSYYVHKYDTPADIGGPPVSPMGNVLSGSGRRIEPPHALFRLGICQFLQSKVGKMIDSKETDELGLTPEARRVLGAVWERHPSTNAWFDDDLVDSTSSLAQTKGTPGENRAASTSASTSSSMTSYQGGTDTSDTDADMSDVQSVTTDTKPRGGRNLHKFHLGLNPVEKALLARACNISVETVEAYWDGMREKTRAWGAMKSWCEVHTRRKINQAKREGRW